MGNPDKRILFERAITPHIDAGYNLARWLMRNDEDAQEAVQEALLRAYKFFDSFRGTDGRAWLLAIVRNSCFTLRGEQFPAETVEEFDEELHAPELLTPELKGRCQADPEQLAIARADRDRVTRAIEELPTEFREVLVLRGIEDLSYKEIAKIAGIPIGTVMSRLARARARLQQQLTNGTDKESSK